MENEERYIGKLHIRHMWVSALIGIAVGIVVSAYRMGIQLANNKAVEIYAYLLKHPVYIAGLIAAIIISGIIIGKIVIAVPESKGSGIPQFEARVLSEIDMRSKKVIPARFVAGFLSGLFGASLGREGPSIQLGSSIGDLISEKFSETPRDKRLYISAGAAAGLAVAFSAPLSGISLVIEEVHKKLTKELILVVAMAAIIGDIISKYFFGLTPVLGFVDLPVMKLQEMPWLLPLGIAAGMLGSLVNRLLLQSSAMYGKIKPEFKVMLALTLAALFGFFLPQVLGGGGNLVKLSETASPAIILLIVLLVSKIIFTTLSFGSGIPGGIFMPILSMGALLGAIYMNVFSRIGMNPKIVSLVCICSMAGLMAASVKSPITSVLLMTEMTGTLVNLVPVAMVAFISYFVSDLLNIDPVYDVLYERIVEKEEEKKAEAGKMA